MRAVVHPARWQVLQAMFEGAELTATQAAAITGLTPSAMSYHLKQLAKQGLIERADATSDGRQRPWRAKGSGLRMSAQPDEYVGDAMNRYLLAAVAKVVAVPPPGPGEERSWPASYSVVRTRLTKEQMKELHERVEKLLDEYDALDSPDGIEYDMFWIHGVRVGA